MIPKTRLKDSKIKFATGIFVVFFLAGVVFLSYLIERQKELSNAIYPNVFIDNINVGEKTKEQARLMFSGYDKNTKKTTLFIKYKDESIATYSAQQLSLQSNVDEILDRAYLVGRTPNVSSRLYQKIATLFHLNTYKFSTNVKYDQDILHDFISKMQDSYDKPAKDALFNFQDGKVTTFRPDEPGLKINADKFITDVEASLNETLKKPGPRTITITDSIVKPDTTLAEANNLGIEELIAEGKSDYTYSHEDRIHNLTLASSKFNGVIIKKGEEFSFNKTLGDVSTRTGYVKGYVILNGKTVLDDGGGVCQVSTTMFRAVMNAGLPITERHNHAYRVIYYENDAPIGYDATIFLPGVDFKFVNDTPGAILVQTEVDPDNNLLYFRFYGKKDGRRSEITKPVITNQSPPPPDVHQEDPTLPRGTTKQVEHAIPGATSTFEYKVFQGDKMTYEKKFVSYYQPWAAVYLDGTKD